MTAFKLLKMKIKQATAEGCSFVVLSLPAAEELQEQLTLIERTYKDLKDYFERTIDDGK